MKTPRRIAIALEIDQPYPHHQAVFAGVQQYARERGGWTCLIDEHPGYKQRSRGAHYPRYDGVIARSTPELQGRLRRMGVPLVNVHYQASRPGLAGVYSDPQAAGRLAAEHLIDRGFRRLAVLLDQNHRHSIQIARGFLAYAEQEEVECARIDFPERTYIDADYWLSLEKSARQWLESLQPPFGLFIETAPMARLVIQVGQALGLHVPQDVAVLSRLDLRSVVDVPPQISSIDENNARSGYEAARLLDRMMNGAAAPAEPVLVPPRGVIARESTDYFAVEDPVVAEALRYISSHLREPLRVEGVAEAIAVSQRSLQKRFSDALGRGVSEEIRRLRLEMAKRLLAEPDHSIAYVAERTGFSSADLLHQVFRRELGLTPSAYRKRIAAGE